MMTTSPDRHSTTAALFTPQWTWQSVFFAAAITIGVYVLIPYLDQLSSPIKEQIEVTEVETVRLPVPKPRLREPLRERIVSPATPLPRPEVPRQTHQLEPIQNPMALRMSIGNVGGDFALDFSLQISPLVAQVSPSLYALDQLDEQPRPLSRLEPIYPSHARLRRIEGFVVLEFTVTEEGVPQDLKCLSSEPDDVFTRSAMRAVSAWRFLPGKVAGKAVATRVRQRVEFKLN